jgi:hypothetical protein
MIFNVNSLSSEEKFALLYGIMLGDGCISRYNYLGRKYTLFSISGDYYSDKPFYSKVLCPLINYIRKDKKPIKIKERLDQGKLEIQFSDKKLTQKFTELGFPLGKKGAKIIQGIFSTDGSLVLTKNPNKYYPRLEIHLITQKLINQTHNFLLSKEIKSKVYECKRNKVYPGFKNLQKKFRVQINGKENLILFNKKIGFVNPKHQLKFEKFIEYDGSYITKIKNILNKRFIESMAALGTEPRTSSS